MSDDNRAFQRGIEAVVGTVLIASVAVATGLTRYVIACHARHPGSALLRLVLIAWGVLSAVALLLILVDAVSLGFVIAITATAAFLAGTAGIDLAAGIRERRDADRVRSETLSDILDSGWD